MFYLFYFIVQTKLLEESNKMVKDTASRLETTAKDLEDLIVRLIGYFTGIDRC